MRNLHKYKLKKNFLMQNLRSQPRPTKSESAFQQHPQKIFLYINIWEAEDVCSSLILRTS